MHIRIERDFQGAAGIPEAPEFGRRLVPLFTRLAEQIAQLRSIEPDEAIR